MSWAGQVPRPSRSRRKGKPRKRSSSVATAAASSASSGQRAAAPSAPGDQRTTPARPSTRAGTTISSTPPRPPSRNSRGHRPSSGPRSRGSGSRYSAWQIAEAARTTASCWTGETSAPRPRARRSTGRSRPARTTRKTAIHQPRRRRRAPSRKGFGGIRVPSAYHTPRIPSRRTREPVAGQLPATRGTFTDGKRPVVLASTARTAGACVPGTPGTPGARTVEVRFSVPPHVARSAR